MVFWKNLSAQTLSAERTLFRLFTTLMIILTNVSVVSAQGGLRYVNATDPTCQGQTPCHQTIQAAIDAVQPGETIRIQAGEYDEAVLIKKKNTASTTESDRIIIEADPTALPGSVMLGSASQKCGKGDAISIEASKFITIRGLTITDAGAQSIVLLGGKKKKNDAIHIEGNRIFGNGTTKCLGGLLIEKENTNTVIANNLIYGNGQYGLNFKAGDGGPHTVVGNTIYANSKSGVFIGKDQEVLLINNIITSNGADPKSEKKDGFGVNRKTPTKTPAPELVRLLHNLLCGNSSGEIANAEINGPVLDGADAGNFTPTGAEGPGVSASPGCDATGNVFANVNGVDGQPNTVDDDFTLATGSLALDSGIDPRTLGLSVELDGLFVADFGKDNARPRDGDASGTAEFDMGAVEIPGGCEPGATESCYTGPAGTQGVGQCQAGTRTCGPDGIFGACQGEVLPGADTPGNSLDEDCDGHDDCIPDMTESCYTGPAGTAGVGICQAGTQTCSVDGDPGACVDQVLPTTEIPGNGIDENCDGVDAPPSDAIPITIGQVVMGEITIAGEQDKYIFTATPGQVVFFDSQQSPSLDLSWTLKDANGGTVFTASQFFDRGPVTLTMGGTYLLTIVGTVSVTGAYKFQIFDVPAPGTTAVSIGEVVMGAIETPGTSDIYTFTATPGQVVFFDSQQSPSIRLVWTLKDANGDTVFTAAQFFDRGPVTLTLGGVYTLTLGQGGDATGSYKFQIFDVPATTTTSINIGDVVSGAIETPGTSDIYTFTATPGQVVFFDSQQSPSIRLVWTLKDANGDTVFTAAQFFDRGPVTLTLGGVYTLTLTGNGSDLTGNYKFQIQPQ